MTHQVMDWEAIHADPRFRDLHRRKSRFLWGLMLLSVAYYFALPIGAGYFQDFFRLRVWGPVNVGLLFALSQFAVAWLVAYIYERRANREFDTLAAGIVADAGGSPAGQALRPHQRQSHRPVGSK